MLATLASSLPFSGMDLSFVLAGGLLLAAIGLALRVGIRRDEPRPAPGVPEVERVGVEAARVEAEPERVEAEPARVGAEPERVKVEA